MHGCVLLCAACSAARLSAAPSMPLHAPPAGYRPTTFLNYREGEGEGARVRPTFYPPTDAPGIARRWQLTTISKCASLDSCLLLGSCLWQAVRRAAELAASVHAELALLCTC